MGHGFARGLLGVQGSSQQIAKKGLTLTVTALRGFARAMTIPITVQVRHRPALQDIIRCVRMPRGCANPIRRAAQQPSLHVQPAPMLTVRAAPGCAAPLARLRALALRLLHAP